jgi:hypothetical protein
LSCCLLNDADAAYLGPGLEYVSGSLETLDLSWNALTATGVASLSRALTARTLRTLDVGDNPALGDNGCEVFAQNILRAGAGALGLESLGLRRVGMTDKGLGAVVDALATAHTLRRLDASRNLITCVMHGVRNTRVRVDARTHLHLARLQACSHARRRTRVRTQVGLPACAQ